MATVAAAGHRSAICPRSCTVLFRAMSLEQKIGQLIYLRPAARWCDEVERMLADGLGGGVCLGAFDAGMDDPDAAAALLARYRRISQFPPFFCANSAQGSSSCVRKGGTRLPSHMALAATRSADLGYEYGQLAGQSLLAMGFNHAGCLVLDVLTNPECYIGARSFGDDPALVAEMGLAAMRGIRHSGQAELAHHFVGKGDSAVDTHLHLGKTVGDLARLERIHVLPFKALIGEGLRSIETGHMQISPLDPRDDVPVTLSRPILTDYLRKKLGFQGLIVTDSLTMRPIKARFGIERAAVMAVQAGNDLVLHDYESDPQITFRALLEACRNGELAIAEIDEKVQRILRHKDAFGLPRDAQRCEEARQDLDVRRCEDAARRMAEQSVTVLSGRGLPLDPRAPTLAIVCYREAPQQRDLSVHASPVRRTVEAELRARMPVCRFLHTAEEPSATDLEPIARAAQEAEQVVLVFAFRHVAYEEGSGNRRAAFRELTRRLAAAGKPVAAVNLGNPAHSLDVCADAASVAAYCDIPESIRAAVQVLFGEIPPRGRLPINLSPRHPFGHGLTSLTS